MKVISPRIFCMLLSGIWACSSAIAFDLQGHRGARGLAPENTLAAFSKALAVGVTTLELDVNLSSDGVVVIHHDLALNPNTTRDSKGDYLSTTGPVVHQLTLQALQSYDVGRIKAGSDYAKPFLDQQPQDGERIPTLASLFALIASKGANDVRFNIETKLSPRQAAQSADVEVLTQALIADIRKAGVEKRTSIQSFDWRTLKIVQQNAPEITTVYLSSSSTLEIGKPGASPWLAGKDIDDFNGSAAEMVKAAGGRVWSPNYRDLTEAQLKAAQTMGLQVIPWTVNDTTDIKRLLDWKVDGLISDYPDRVRNAMEAQGLPLPKRYP